MSMNRVHQFVKGTGSSAPPPSEEEKQRANRLKFEQTPFSAPLETHLESSKEHLPEQNHGPFVDENNRANNAQSLRPSPQAMNGGNQAVSNPETPAPGVDQHRNKSVRHLYHQNAYSSLGNTQPPESPFESDDDLAAAPGPRRDVFADFESALAHSRAAYDRRSEALGRGRVATPDSYPPTSDGQQTQQFQSPPNTNQLPQLSRRPQHVSPRKVRHADGQSTHTNDEVHGRKSFQGQYDLASPPSSMQPHSHSNGVDEHAARQILERAQDYHKAHARRNSQPPASSHSRKPSRDTSLPHRSRPATTEPTHAGTGPNISKAFETLGLPHPSASVRFDTHSQRCPERNASGSATPGEKHKADFSHRDAAYSSERLDFPTPPHADEPLLDYEPDVLYSKDYNDLAAESFDIDPHAPRDPDSTPLNIPKTLERLLKSLSTQSQSQDAINTAESFVESLTLDDWNTVGSWLIDEFTKAEKTITQRREQRREIAKKFEAEVARREGAVQNQLQDVDGEMGEMKRSGGMVLEGRTPVGKRTR
ncbi:MAG: hypothetical protein Q9159_007507 [Coniocarpon cinnabarinum]